MAKAARERPVSSSAECVDSHHYPHQTANKFEMFIPPRYHFILANTLFPFPKICANALLLPIQVEALDGQSGTRAASKLFC
jgi:hypothetical protein